MNTNGLYSSNDITLSGDDDAIFDVINANTLTVTRNSTAAVNALLGSTINVGSLLQNLNFSTTARYFEIWNDQSTGQIIAVDVSNNVINISTVNMNILTNTALNFVSPLLTFTNSAVSFPNSTVSFNSYLPTSTITTTSSGTQFITRDIADGRYGQLANSNTWTSTNTFNSTVSFANGSIVNLDANDNMFVGQNAGSSLPLGGILNAFFGYNSGLNCRGSYNVALGYGTLSSTQGTSPGNGYLQGNCCFGYNAGAYFSGTSSQPVYNNTCVGLWSGQYHQLGDNNTFIGYAAGSDGLGAWNDSIAIGTFAHITGNNQIILGRSTEMTYPMGGLTIPSQQQLILQDKTNIQCCQYLTGATINLSFTTNEYVILQSATTTVINLPTPNATDSRNVGCKFTIIRAVTSTNNITINAPSGQTIGEGQEDGTLTAGGNYLFRKGESQVSIVCIANSGMSYMILNTSISQATDNLYISSVIPSPTTNYALTFGGLSTSQYYPQFSDTTNLNYKPSTQTLTATNITTGALSISNKVNLATNQNAVSNPTLSFSTAENVLLTDGATTALILPIPFAANVGTKFVITRRIAGLDITINAPALQFVGYTLADGSYVTSSTYTFSKFMQSITALCIGTSGNSWLLIEGQKATTETQNTLITGATTLTNPLRSYYPFTMKTTAGYTITLPEVTATNVGTQLTFKRIGGSLQNLTISMSANQPAFLLGNAVGSTANYTLVSTVQSCGVITAIQSQDAGSGTFTNTAGSTTVNITAQTSGTLSIGGIINLNGNIRFITAYSGTVPIGIGGTGNYVINSAIAAANTNQPYTSSLTYGWSVVSVQ